MKEAATCLNMSKFDQLICTCDKIKIAAKHSGAHRLFYVADLIETACQNKKYNRVLDYYPYLVESFIEYKKYWRQLKAEYLCQVNQIQINSQIEDSPVAEIYSLNKHPESGQIYCLIKN